MKRKFEEQTEPDQSKRTAVTLYDQPFQDPQPLLEFGERILISPQSVIPTPIGMAIHPNYGLIFVAESPKYNPTFVNSRIRIFTCDGDYVTLFDVAFTSLVWSFSITIDELSIYVLDAPKPELAKYSDFSTKFQRLFDFSSSRCSGPVCDKDGFVYVLHCIEGRIYVHDSDLELVRHFRLDTALYTTRLNMLSNNLVILCHPTSIYYCTVFGLKLRLISLEEHISEADNFCVDPVADNTLITDESTRCINIFNIEGQLVRTIPNYPLELCDFRRTIYAVTPDHTLVMLNAYPTVFYVSLSDP